MIDALRDLVPFAQFQKREKHTWGSVTFSRNFTKSNTPQWVFFTFSKLCKWYQIAQSISYSEESTTLPYCPYYRVTELKYL